MCVSVLYVGAVHQVQYGSLLPDLLLDWLTGYYILGTCLHMLIVIWHNSDPYRFIVMYDNKYSNMDYALKPDVYIIYMYSNICMYIYIYIIIYKFIILSLSDECSFNKPKLRRI